MLVSWATTEPAPLMFIVPLSVIVTPCRSGRWHRSRRSASPLLHREGSREDVDQVDAVWRAHAVPGTPTARCQAAGVDVDAWKLWLAVRSGTSMTGAESGGGEDVVGEVAAVEHASR